MSENYSNWDLFIIIKECSNENMSQSVELNVLHAELIDFYTAGTMKCERFKTQMLEKFTFSTAMLWL